MSGPRDGRMIAWVTAGLTGTVVLIVSAVPHAPHVGPRERDGYNLKLIGLLFQMRHDREDGLPVSTDGAGVPPVAWATALLPYLNQPELAESYNRAAPFDAPANAAAVAAEIEPLLTPHPDWADRRSEGGFGLAHYAGNARVFDPNGVRRWADVTDGLSETILAGGVGGFPRPWADPANLRDAADGTGAGPRQFGGPYGGVQVVLCDGSVRFIGNGVDPAVFAALGTPVGGEAVTDRRPAAP